MVNRAHFYTDEIFSHLFLSLRKGVGVQTLKIMSKKRSYTKKELREKLMNGIQRMDEILTGDEDDAHKNVQAANAQGGLVKKYYEIFGIESDDESENKDKPGLRSVKNY